MRLLGLETATTAAVVALIDGDSPRELVATTDRRHTETLLPAVSTVLAEAGLAVGDLDGVVIDVGPGLFTGLRVGVSSARSLAAAAGIPLFSVTSLEVLAADPRTPEDGTVLSIVDARRGEVFVQCFTGPRSSRRAMAPPLVCRPDELSDLVAPLAGEVVAVGDGARRYGEAALSPLGVDVLSTIEFPSALVACRLVIDDRRSPGALEEVVPLYLRDPDAIANFTVAPGRQT